MNRKFYNEYFIKMIPTLITLYEPTERFLGSEKRKFISSLKKQMGSFLIWTVHTVPILSVIFLISVKLF